jgi:APA family basic amino acid/polyamine antiporter
MWHRVCAVTHAVVPASVSFRRELGLYDAAVVVAGGMIGVGIFANPSNVARIVHRPSLIILSWALGGGLALLGGFAYAELASRLPLVGGQYTYLARAYHPVIGFLYGVAMLFIINGGAIAAVSIVFASYLDRSFLPLGPHGVRPAGAVLLLVLTALHACGIKAGTWTNNLLMAAKILGIGTLMLLAFWRGGPSASTFQAHEFLRISDLRLIVTALVPIMFAYGGWQNCGSIAGEIRDPSRNLALANIVGVVAVVLLYVGLNVVYLRVLTPEQIASSNALAADVSQALAGPAGSRFVAGLILVSSLGFLSVIILTAPRLYYAMAQDGLFFRRAGVLHPRFRTPTLTLWLQALISIALLLTNSYQQLLSYVVFADWLFFGLTVGALFILRRQPAAGVYLMPGYPVTTLLFVLAAAGIVVNSFFVYTTQSLVGSLILLAGAATYFILFPRARP